MLDDISLLLRELGGRGELGDGLGDAARRALRDRRGRRAGEAEREASEVTYPSRYLLCWVTCEVTYPSTVTKEYVRKPQ